MQALVDSSHKMASIVSYFLFMLCALVKECLLRMIGHGFTYTVQSGHTKDFKNGFNA